MPDHWRSIEELPATYRTMVAGVLSSNLNLTRAGIRDLPLRDRALPGLLLIRSARIRTRAYLTTAQQDIRFLFFPGEAAEDVMLHLELAFEVTAAPGRRPVQELALPNVAMALRTPPFFASDIGVRERHLLAAALEAKDARRIVFLRVGDTLLGATGTADWRVARMVRLQPDASHAVDVYRRIAGAADRIVLRYEPRTFLRVIEELAHWSRTD